MPFYNAIVTFTAKPKYSEKSDNKIIPNLIAF